MVYYNITDTCEKIIKVGFSWEKHNKAFHGKAYREYDKNGNWTGRWICKQCYGQLMTWGTTDNEIIKKIRYPYYGKICHMCTEEKDVTKRSVLCSGNSYLERDKDGKETGEMICHRHYMRRCNSRPDSTNNIKKSVTNTRIGNLAPSCSRAKGDMTQKLVHILYGWVDLNKENDNYNSEVDFQDPITGLLHQVQGRSLAVLSTYITINGEERYCEGWGFANLEDEWHKNYEDMVLVCMSKDRIMIEEIYKIPFKNIYDLDTDNGRKSIGIMKNSRHGWYEEYRVKDLEELKMANEIWQNILEEDRR